MSARSVGCAKLKCKRNVMTSQNQDVLRLLSSGYLSMYDLLSRTKFKWIYLSMFYLSIYHSSYTYLSIISSIYRCIFLSKFQLFCHPLYINLFIYPLCLPTSVIVHLPTNTSIYEQSSLSIFQCHYFHIYQIYIDIYLPFLQPFFPFIF